MLAPIDPTASGARIEKGDPLNRADSIGILGVLVGTFFVLIAPAVWVKASAFVLLCFGIVYFLWLWHWTYRLRKLWRVALITMVLVVLNVIAVPQFIKQWRSEHMRSELTFKASAPGIAYPDGDHYGIKWSKTFSEVRLSVTSKASFPIQNLSLSIGPEDKGDEIAGMAQSEDEPEGCVIRRPREVSFPPLILRGIDGSRADVSPFMNDLMNKAVPFGDHYDLLCQRILAGETIPLVIGSLTSKQNGDMSVPPSRLHIKGDYETTAAEGSKRVPVNESIAVYTLPPWK